MPVARRPGCGAEVLASNLPVTVAAGNPFPTFGAWVALGTPGAGLFLTRIQARRLAVPASAGNNIIELGYGAGPTALDVIRCIFAINDGPPANDVGYLPADLNTYNTKVPAGQSLQARISDANAGVNWEIWTCGWSGAVPTFTPLVVASPAGAARYYPSNTSLGLTPASGTSPAYGAWLTVIDPAPNDLPVTALHCGWLLGNFLATGVAYQLGIGAAGAEQPVGTFLQGHATNAINIDPPVWVLAGERLAVRAASSGASNRNVLVKVTDL
jgi:hypothetical protein